MIPEQDLSNISPHGRQAVLIYEERLKSVLEPDHNGEMIAIDPITGDYEVAKSHRDAKRALRPKIAEDHPIVTLTIGPPTPSDEWIASRALAGGKA